MNYNLFSRSCISFTSKPNAILLKAIKKRVGLSASQMQDVIVNRNRRMYTSETKLSTSPIYELRTYKSRPAHFQQLNEIFNKQMALRTKHSKLVGFWTAEVGETIQQVVHLWEYESLSQRAKVRYAIAFDMTLVYGYLSRVMPLMTEMTNHLVLPAPNTKLDLSFKGDSKAVYVLQTVNSADKQADVPESKNNDEKLVARLTSVLGPGNTEFRLWRYQNMNSVTECCFHRAIESPTKGSSLLMYPTQFSPMR